MDNKPKQRIEISTATFMVIVALLFDGLQFLLVFVGIGFLVNWIINLYAWLTFWLWFKIKGVKFSSTKNFSFLNGAGLIELIPLLNALPAWTLAVLLLIASTKADDLLKTA